MRAEIDYKKLAVMLLPTFLRKPLTVALARVLAVPLDSLNYLFRQRRDAHLYNLAHNGQVCRLKHALNDLYGYDYSNGFEIEDINAIGDFIFVYDETDLFLDTDRVWMVSDAPDYTMVYDEAAINIETCAFVVFCPTEIAFDGSRPAEPQIIDTVERYRLVSRTATYRHKP